MRRILSVGVALGLVGSAIVGSTSVQAVPDAQIVDKLKNIPVFTLTDKNGAPLTAAVNGDPKKGNFTGVYLSLKDAQAFLQKLQREKPDLAKQLQTQAVPLSEIYKLQVAKKIDIAFVPTAEQVSAALAIAKKSNASLKQFNGVPLFVGRAGKPKGYITVDQNQKKIIPLFFDKEQLQPYVDKFKKDNPKLAATAGIEVITLESFLDTLRSKNDPLYDRVTIVPSREGLEFIRSQQKPAR
jgi:nickel transport protein